MYLISHRGNINSIEKDRENSPDYINEALYNGFDVEVDVRFESGKFFLGHDFNQFEIDKEFLQNDKIWCHAKTNEASLVLIFFQPIQIDLVFYISPARNLVTFFFTCCSNRVANCLSDTQSAQLTH